LEYKEVERPSEELLENAKEMTYNLIQWEENSPEESK
jgi:hypothetical protein